MKRLFQTFMVLVVSFFLLTPVYATINEGSPGKTTKSGSQQQTMAQEQPVQEESWEELNLKVTNLYKEQKFMKASGLNKYVIHVARQLPESEKEKLAISLGNMSMIATHLGKFMDAEESAWEELAILQKIYGKRTLEVLKAWNHLALIYTMAQVPEDAEQCLKTIIEIEEEHYGKEDAKVIPSYKKLLKFYQISKNKKKEKELTARLKKLEKTEKITSKK